MTDSYEDLLHEQFLDDDADESEWECGVVAGWAHASHLTWLPPGRGLSLEPPATDTARGFLMIGQARRSDVNVIEAVHWDGRRDRVPT